MLGAILGSVLGGLIQGNSASDAADAQERASREQLALMREVYGDTRGNIAPWLNGGQSANNALMFELGLGPRPTTGGAPLPITTIPPGGAIPAAATGQYITKPHDNYGSGRNNFPSKGPAAPQGNFGPRFGPSQGGWGGGDRENPSTNGGGGAGTRPNGGGGQGGGQRYSVGGRVFNSLQEAQAYANANATGGTDYRGFQATPGYQFMLDQGMEALQGSAAAGGSLLSGNTLKDITKFSQGLADQQYDDYITRLFNVSNSGQNAAAMQGSAAQNYASGSSNALSNLGNAGAAGAIGQGNAWAGAINNGIGLWANQNALNSGNNATLGDTPWGVGGFW